MVLVQRAQPGAGAQEVEGLLTIGVVLILSVGAAGAMVVLVEQEMPQEAFVILIFTPVEGLETLEVPEIQVVEGVAIRAKQVQEDYSSL